MSDHSNQKASLGCGSLILIALIAAIFGGWRTNKNLEKKLDEVPTREEVREIVREALEEERARNGGTE